jgi:hypothetical protein
MCPLHQTLQSDFICNQLSQETKPLNTSNLMNVFLMRKSISLSAAIHLVEGRPETFFVKAAHSMAASDAERIAVDAAAQVVSGKPVGENSALAQHYGGLSNSLSMLTERLEVLLDYLTKVQSGTVPTNQQVLVIILCACDWSGKSLTRDFFPGRMVS